jgi:cold shock CspA family protein
MHTELDNRAHSNDTLIRDLFSEPKRRAEFSSEGSGTEGPFTPNYTSGAYAGSSYGATNSYGSRPEREPRERLPLVNPDAPFAQAGSTNIESTIQDMKDGYGFIYANPNNVFFHYSNVKGEFDDLQVNDTVRFDVEVGQRGLKAVNVERIGSNASMGFEG